MASLLPISKEFFTKKRAVHILKEIKMVMQLTPEEILENIQLVEVVQTLQWGHQAAFFNLRIQNLLKISKMYQMLLQR